MQVADKVKGGAWVGLSYLFSALNSLMVGSALLLKWVGSKCEDGEVWAVSRATPYR